MLFDNFVTVITGLGFLVSTSHIRHPFPSSSRAFFRSLILTSPANTRPSLHPQFWTSVPLSVWSIPPFPRQSLSYVYIPVYTKPNWSCHKGFSVPPQHLRTLDFLVLQSLLQPKEDGHHCPAPQEAFTKCFFLAPPIEFSQHGCMTPHIYVGIA